MILEIVLCIVLLWLLIQFTQRPRNFPPGPRGLPLVGYAPFINQLVPGSVHKSTMKLAERYGPVVGFYMGPQQAAISVCGYEASKEALLNDDLIGRPTANVLLAKDNGKRLGIMFVDGEFWKEQRRFTLRHLRDLGFGRTSLEGLIFDEMEDLFQDMKDKLQSNADNIIDFNCFFNTSVTNVLWAITAGKRFSRHDPKFSDLMKKLEDFFQSGQAVSSFINLPVFLLRLFPILQKYFGQDLDGMKPLQHFVQEIIAEHEKNFVKGEPQDFIDIYLNELMDQKNKEDSSFSCEQLIATVLEVFTAGTHTTSNSIGFALLHLIHHPEIQDKMQKELDDVCRSSLPSLSQRSQLPYTEAVLLEIQRLSSAAPISVPHLAVKDTSIKGYFVPKGSIVFVNIYSVHMEEEFWKDPEIFRPERHLDHEGKLIKSDRVIPFSLGKRSCMGESLARNIFFLFVAGLVKRFRFSSIPGEPLPDLNPEPGITLSFKRFSAVVTPRFNTTN